MRPTFRKLEVKDIGTLGRLIAENVDGVEPGLKVVDSRLLLGQVSIDLVGLDAQGSLVLIAFDFSADDGLLLRVMDAYSWCLEYPETLRRLYPMAHASSRPPRILFIVEKMTDSFLRRLKQLSFLEIDCFEFRNLEVNGASVVYFDLVERLRKEVVGSTVEAPVPAPAIAAPVAAPAVDARVEPVRPAIEWPTRVASREAEPKRVEPSMAVVTEPVRLEPAPVAVAAPEPVAPIVAVPSAPAPVVEQPTIVVQSAPAPVVEQPTIVVQSAPAPVVEQPTVVVRSVPASIEEQPQIVVESAPAPIVEPPSVVVEAQGLPVEHQAADVVAEEAPVLQAPEPVAVMPTERALQLEAIESTSMLAHTNGHAPEPKLVTAPVIEAAPRIAAPVEEIKFPTPAVVVIPEVRPAPVVRVEPAPAPVQTSPVWAKPGAQANGARPQFFAHATKGTTPVEAPAVVAAVAASAEPATPPAASKVGLEVDDRPELESLSFPKDGLSRQWLEFLSQLGATK